MDLHDSVGDVCHRLAKAERAVFAVHWKGDWALVNAKELVDALLTDADLESVRRRADLPLEEALKQVRPSPFLAEEKFAHKIEHKTLLNPATQRLIYVCDNGHENTDPDSWTCYTCPARIVRTVTK